MEQIRGFCQRVCNECTIFQATQQNDDIRRAGIAQTLSEIYDRKFNPQDINCDGCTTTDGHLFVFARDCSVRNREMQRR